LKRARTVSSLRKLTAGVAALTAAVAFLFGGVVDATAASSVLRSHREEGGLLSSDSSQKPSVAVDFAAGPGSKPTTKQVSLSASSWSPGGRAFSYGFDLANAVPQNSESEATATAAQITRSIPGTFEDVPIMGWGTGNPEPSPGIYDFSQIARQIQFVEVSGGIPVITLCASPDWMKGGEAGTTDWNDIDVAPQPQHFQDFADLAAEVAKAFPQVRYFVVWNELKGFWDSSTNRWDMAAYTSLYNDVFRAIKIVRPDALVGGPYVSMRSLSGATPVGGAPSGPWGHLDPASSSAVLYWLAHKVGADFVAVDGRAFTVDAGLTTDPLTSTGKYAAVDRWLEVQTSLPIVWMESHVLPDPSTADQRQQAALRIAVLLQMASSGASLGMQWNPEQDSAWDEGLWTSPGVLGPDQPTVLAQELPKVLAVLAAPVAVLSGQPPGTLAVGGTDGSVTVTLSSTQASVAVDGMPV
jgi:hypothetical protein